MIFDPQSNHPINLTVRPGYPDFNDLPWELPVTRWQGHCQRLEEVPKGLSRHPLVFVNYDGILFALKELPAQVAFQEYESLLVMESLRLPSVTPVGYASDLAASPKQGILITRYLEHSIPIRTLFMGNRLVRYQEHLLDSIAGLLVQLHLADVYWGDCSLSNTLFRRNAGELQAYLVDAETAEVFPNDIPATMRHQDLEIMEENINGDLADLAAEHRLNDTMLLSESGAYIRLRYQRLLEEITREDIIKPDEHYRIQERIRALNQLGFSVGNVELWETEHGDQLRLRVAVTDRNFHRDQLLSLTGLEAEEMQARKMMNEIQEQKASLSKSNNRSTPLSVASYHWVREFYQPTIERLKPLIKPDMNAAELYCQVLEHKWYLSEAERHDVGHQYATEDYFKRFIGN